MARNRSVRPRRAKRRIEPIVLALLLIVSFVGFSGSSKAVFSAASPMRAVEAAEPLTDAREPLVLPEPLAESATLRETRIAGRGFTYCANGSIDSPPTDVSRVIVVIHGNDRRACSVAAAALAAGAPEERANTLVVAPWFPLRDDRVNPNTHLFWSYHSWSRGDESANDDVRISSYAVVDEILDRIDHPKTIVVGFSGGGQFVGRYSAGTSREPQRFVIANPSTYLYWSPERPGATQKQLAECPTYNDYRYGLNKLNNYMGEVDEETLKRRFAERRVTYLLGTYDNDPRSASLDNSCGARTQGTHRFERGERYWNYLPSVFGPRIHQRHRMIVVPKVGHNANQMFQHPESHTALYG